VWIVDDGKITFYAGDFDDYKAELVKEIAAEMDEGEEEEAGGYQKPTMVAG
jgi:roadblock/LC7 domain-containing protein